MAAPPSLPTLPATLTNGIISIYGAGSNVSEESGIQVQNISFYFGYINQVNVYSAYSVGDSVMFDEGGVVTRVIYSGWPYTLVNEDKVILIETVAP